MTGSELVNSLSVSEQSMLASALIFDTTFSFMWEKFVRLSPGQVITHDNYAAIVGLMDTNSWLDDSSRLSTLMSVQPTETSGPDIRVV